MGQTADTLRDDIEARRRAMTHDVNELEHRAKSMTDWRQQMNDRPLAALGVAAAGGMILGLLTGGSSDDERTEDKRGSQYAYGFQSQYQPQHFGQQQETHNGDSGPGVGGWVTGERGPSQATQVGKDRAASKFDEIRGALMGLAATKAEEFLKEALPGFSQEVDQVQQKRSESAQDEDRSQKMGSFDGSSSSSSSTSSTSQPTRTSSQ